jgi:hypothetical protein
MQEKQIIYVIDIFMSMNFINSKGGIKIRKY